MKTITNTELEEMLLAHYEWLADATKGARLNLSHTDISGFNLSGKNLHSANLAHADLSYTDLSNANLSYAIISDADLSHSNLTDANLSHAVLKRANLTSATLCCTNLNSTILMYANLEDARAYGASINSKTCLPDNVFHLIGYDYTITFINERIQVGCKNFTYKEWLKMTKKRIIEMDGRQALKFYPTLVKLIKFHYDL